MAQFSIEGYYPDKLGSDANAAVRCPNCRAGDTCKTGHSGECIRPPPLVFASFFSVFLMSIHQMMTCLYVPFVPSSVLRGLWLRLRQARHYKFDIFFLVILRKNTFLERLQIFKQRKRIQLRVSLA